MKIGTTQKSMADGLGGSTDNQIRSDLMLGVHGAMVLPAFYLVASSHSRRSVPWTHVEMLFAVICYWP